MPILQRLSKYSGELVTLALLIPLAVMLGALLWGSEERTLDPTSHATPLATASPANSPRASATPVPAARQVTLQIANPAGTQEHTIALALGQMSVADILTQAAQAGTINLKTTDFGGTLGLFVEEINGLHSDPANRLYWHLYVNGQRSPLGASSAPVKADDTITWSYEKEHAE